MSLPTSSAVNSSVGFHSNLRRKKAGAWIAAGLIAAGFAVIFRLYPVVVFPTIETEKKAELIVYSRLQKSIGSALSAQAFAQWSNENRSHIRTAIRNLSRQLRETTRKNPYYLMEADPYYYRTMAQHLLEGSPKWKRQGRNYLNDRTLAPVGVWYPLDLHPYVGAFFFTFVHAFIPEISLDLALGLVPLFLALCAIPLFFAVARRLGCGPVASGLGAVTLVCAPIYLRRTLIGWFDTDSYNILFPLMIAWAILTALDLRTKKIGPVFLSVLALAGYSLFWRGWLLPYSLFAAAFLGTFLLSRFRFFQDVPRHFGLKLLLFIGCPLLFIPLLWGLSEPALLIRETVEFVRRFSLPSFSIWPDVFLTVGELKTANLKTLVSEMGGWLIPFLALAGFSLEIKPRESAWGRSGSLFLALYFVGTAILGTQIERFGLLFVVPTAIGFSLALKHLFLWAENRLPALNFWARSAVVSGLAVLGIFFVVWDARAAHEAVRYEHPIYNSTWDRAMTAIREQTPPRSIITSWWCPGHFITSKGERRVTFDGSTQNVPQAYWVARLFLESSEKQSLGILRMLDLSGNRAVEWLAAKGLKISQAVDLIERIAPLDKKSARSICVESLSPWNADELLELTHGSTPPPPAYLFVYNDMVEGVLAMEYIGNWNFAKAEQFAQTLKGRRSKMGNLLKRASPENVSLMWSLSERPMPDAGEGYVSKRHDGNLLFSNQISVEPESHTAVSNNKTFGIGTVRSVLELQQEGLVRYPGLNPRTPLSVLFIDDDKSRPGPERIVAADERLLTSLLFRLYYLKGQGLRHIRLVYSEENFDDRTRVYLFEVTWPLQD